MATNSRRGAGGQAIVLVAFIMVVLLGFAGLAIDSGHAYLDRREMQAAVDAAALAAAYRYMNTSDYGQSEQAGAAVYAQNERLYGSYSCSGDASRSVTCNFGDSSGQTLSISVADHSIAGVTFTATGRHNIAVAMMQVLGTGPSVPVTATATAMARRPGSNGAAIQTLSPAGCAGSGNSLTFTGTSTTLVTGDIWSNGSITDNGSASGSVNGNVIDICPAIPPSPLPNFSVTGSQVNGWTMPDPGFAQPPLNTTPQNWLSASGSVEQPGTFASNPNITGSGCYFLNGGVYDWQAGFKFNGGFISNELRPPDEPSVVSITTTITALSGTVTAIPVNPLGEPLPAGFQIRVGAQTLTTSGSAAIGATAIAVSSQPVAGTIAAGAPVVVPLATTTTASLSGNISSIPVVALSAALPGSTSQQSSYVSVGGQMFVVASSGAGAGANSIPLKNPAQSVTGTIASGSWVTVRAYNQFWDSNGVGCSSSFTLSTSGSDINNSAVTPQLWAVELTAARWFPDSCTGQAPGCYLRETAPSMCKTITVGNNQIIKVSVSNSPANPGAKFFNVYLAPNGSCQGPFGYVTAFSNSGSYGVTINGSALSGWALAPLAGQDISGAPVPDFEGPAISCTSTCLAAQPVAGLPNTNPPSAAPPHGDLANEGHCANVSTGASVACPSGMTPGAVAFFIPGPGSNTVCLNLQGGGDIYAFSGYQYRRILIFEPGPQQPPPANTCPNNVAGHGLTSLIGIFYVPAADVTIIGSSSYLATIAGGVISYTASVKGNGGVSISVDPSLRAWPSAVHLTQ